MQDHTWQYPAVLRVILAYILLMLLCITPVSSATIGITVSGNIADMTLEPENTKSFYSRIQRIPGGSI
jgi:hypothetical protein